MYEIVLPDVVAGFGATVVDVAEGVAVVVAAVVLFVGS